MILQQHKLHIFLITFMVPNIVEAEGFVRLTGLPGSLQNDLSTAGYINALYILSISVAAFLAVARIILAGVQYMLTDVVTTKGEARKQITSALLGLLIVLGAVLILETINPQLTNWNALDNICGSGNNKPDCSFNARGGINIVQSECAATNEDGECIIGKTDAQRLREQNIKINETLETVEITEEEQEALTGAEGAEAQGEVKIDIKERQADFGEEKCGCTFPDRKPGDIGRPRGCLGVDKIFNNGTFIGFQCVKP